jgi:hypothetical protein
LFSTGTTRTSTLALSELTNGIQQLNLPAQTLQQQVSHSKSRRITQEESLGPQSVKKDSDIGAFRTLCQDAPNPSVRKQYQRKHSLEPILKQLKRSARLYKRACRCQLMMLVHGTWHNAHGTPRQVQPWRMIVTARPRSLPSKRLQLYYVNPGESSFGQTRTKSRRLHAFREPFYSPLRVSPGIVRLGQVIDLLKKR